MIEVVSTRLIVCRHSYSHTMSKKADNFDYICRLDEIEVGSKRCFYLPSTQRSILLIHLRHGEVFCIDQTCYRTCISYNKHQLSCYTILTRSWWSSPRRRYRGNRWKSGNYLSLASLPYRNRHWRRLILGYPANRSLHVPSRSRKIQRRQTADTRS